MSKKKSEEFRHGMPFIGGRLWLDALNTVVADGGRARDVIASAEGLAAWLEAAGIAGSAIGSAADGQRIRKQRELLRTAFETMQQGDPPSKRAVEEINRYLGDIRFSLQLVAHKEELWLEWRREAGQSGPAGVIAEDFARFACDHEPARLKHCANPGCTMVFYDKGKNNTRRWCTMSICGNRDKIARFRSRSKQR